MRWLYVLRKIEVKHSALNVSFYFKNGNNDQREEEASDTELISNVTSCLYHIC